MIRISQVRVIDEEGTQLGVMATSDALRLAQERGYDLVEVAPTASPPVTRLLDYGQYKYELAKRDKEAKRKSRSVEFKEGRLKPKIGVGDFDTKGGRCSRSSRPRSRPMASWSAHRCSRESQCTSRSRRPPSRSRARRPAGHQP